MQSLSDKAPYPSVPMNMDDLVTVLEHCVQPLLVEIFGTHARKPRPEDVVFYNGITILKMNDLFEINSHTQKSYKVKDLQYARELMSGCFMKPNLKPV